MFFVLKLPLNSVYYLTELCIDQNDHHKHYIPVVPQMVEYLSVYSRAVDVPWL